MPSINLRRGPPPASDTAPAAARPSFKALFERLVTGWALLGGGLFCLLVLMSIVSIVSRKLFAAPIQGDVELLQMGAAVGAAAFLPLCELGDHHIKVDALTTRLSARARGLLDAVAHSALAAMAILLTWRTALYTLEAHENGEVSTLLLVPLWIPVALMLPSLLLLVLAALSQAHDAARFPTATQGGHA